MATDMTLALREFARKKLSEAKQKGATLATATAASLPAATASFAFRGAQAQAREQQPRSRATGDEKLQTLQQTNAALHETLAGGGADTLGGAVYKMELINESLAFSIENIQECAHVLALLHRQLRDSAGMTNEAHKTFYRPTPVIQDGAPDAEIRYEY